MAPACPRMQHALVRCATQTPNLCARALSCLPAQAVYFVRERLLEGKTPRQVCEEVCDRCLAPDTGGCGKGCDNMSIVVVVLKPFAEQMLSRRSSGAAAQA